MTIYGGANIPDIRDDDYLDALFDIERLRGATTQPTIHSSISESLYLIYADLTDLASARIEGNKTTVNDALTRSPGRERVEEALLELDNLRRATEWVRAREPNITISRNDIAGIHEMIVHNLVREGDPTPGQFRRHKVSVAGSELQTTLPALIESEIDQLLIDVNRVPPPRLQIANVAMAHLRFTQIHPFGNGNGRTARLLTALQLKQMGFTTNDGIPLSPTAVFGQDRSSYYHALESGDRGTEEGLTEWIRFVAFGLRDDMRRLHALSDRSIVTAQIIEVALAEAVDARIISHRERDIALIVAREGAASAASFSSILTGSASSRSQKIKPIVDRGIISPIAPSARQYVLPLHRGPLVSFVLRALDNAGFIPPALRG